ncbi:DUF6153 family protein [Amycolatopsis sp. NPDC004625]|uniref:DUF6153 family protein n=1 Tax=Amycolatopsis sp. NPDC004625 TaxID=3154670 RepID=UPI0033B41CC6
MAADRLGRVQRVLLLCALALGVVAMHHVGMADAAGGTAIHAMADPGPPAATGSGSGSGDHDPGGLHDVLHLCLAVLCAAGALLLTVVLFLGAARCTTKFSRTIGSRGPPGRGRPPDGRRILTSLCVLRT